MRRRLFFWELAGFLFTSAAGTLLHFTYQWSGHNMIVAAFSGVNESTWEHMKLLFFPMFSYALFAGKKIEEEYPCVYNSMFTGILAGLALIPTLFYTYTGILGFSVDWVNIALYIVSVLAAYYMVYRVAEKCTIGDSKILRYVMYALLLAFMIFSVYPPKLGIFVSTV